MSLRMPFGQHKDEKLEDLPSSYITWLLEQKDFVLRQDLELELENQMKLRRGEGVRRG